jgi:hypothetical protein
MTRNTNSGIEQLIAWKDALATKFTQLAAESMPANVPRGMALELAVEAMEEALQKLWDSRRAMGALSSTVPEPQDPTPSSDATQQTPVSGKRRGRKAKEPQVGPSPVDAADEPQPVLPGVSIVEDEFTLN